MIKNPQDALDRIQRVVTAWQSLRPQMTLAGMTLDQFKALLQPSFDTRKSLAELEARRAALIAQRDDADKVSLLGVLRIVNTVKGHPEAGDDSDLYEAMGYVRRSARKSGLTRARQTVEP